MSESVLSALNGLSNLIFTATFPSRFYHYPLREKGEREREVEREKVERGRKRKRGGEREKRDIPQHREGRL